MSSPNTNNNTFEDLLEGLKKMAEEDKDKFQNDRELQCMVLEGIVWTAIKDATTAKCHRCNSPAKFYSDHATKIFSCGECFAKISFEHKKDLDQNVNINNCRQQ